jgi:hypothetical protein
LYLNIFNSKLFSQHFEGVGTDGRIILKWTLLENGQDVEMRVNCSGQGPMVNISVHGNENVGKIKKHEFADQLSNYLFRKDPASRS